MGKKNTEIRTFLGGVNSDDTPSFVGKDELLNAINVTVSNPYGGNFGDAQDTLALRSMFANLNTGISSITTGGGTFTLLGKVADTRTNTIFFFFFNSLNNHVIASLSKDGTTAVLFRNNYAIDGLKWNANLYISARLAGNNLIFTDPINGARFIDITKTYTVGTVTKDELSFIRPPFAPPLSCSRVTNSLVFNFSAQLGTFQFAVRVKDIWGYETVLSPLSETIFPERQTNIQANAFSGNTIKADLNFQAIIPTYWENIDFVVKNMSDNTYFVYKSYNKNIAADVSAVSLHNAGTTALSAIYEGVELYTLDTNSASKQFESIPIASEHLEIMANRLMLANNLNGYDTPTAIPTNLTITQNTQNTVMPASTGVKVYMITTKNYTLKEDEYPVYAGLFVYYAGEIWGLPKEYSVLRFNGEFVLKCSDLDGATCPYYPPQTVHKSALIKMPNYLIGTFADLFPDPFAYFETRSSPANNGFNLSDALTPTIYRYKIPFAKYVWDLHELGENPSGDWKLSTTTADGYNGFSRFRDFSIFVMDDANEFVGVKSRAFLPNATYNLGVRYYDYALRSCGDQFLQKITIPDYNPFSRQITESIRVQITGANPAPLWASYFAITLSKNSICQNFLNFTPTIIKVARTNKDGIKYVTSDWLNNIQSDELYGIAVPLDSLESYNQGYSFAQGDYVRLSFATGTPIGYSGSQDYVAAVIDVIDGHVIISAPNTEPILFSTAGNMSAQYDKISSPAYDPLLLAPISATEPLVNTFSRQTLCYATIYQQEQSDINNYEVAAIGAISGSLLGYNIWRDFYKGTTTGLFVEIYGDCHTQERASNTAAFTGLSTTTNDRAPQINWAGIWGRISPVDTIGQTKAVNEIRWSNTGDQSLNANLNGMNKFDFSDYELTNYTAGAINMLLGEIGDIGRDKTLLIICSNNGYSTLINQDLIRNTDGNGQLVASSKFISNIIEINGSPATSSPRSFDSSNGKVIWADVQNKQVVMYEGGKVTSISDAKAKRLFFNLFKNAEINGNQAKIYGGFHPLGNEYILGYKSQTEVTKPPLVTTTLEYPLSFYYQKSYSWVFNIETGKWTSIIPKMLEVVNLNDKVYCWDSESQVFQVMFEPSILNPDYNSLVVIPFNSNYDYVKTALALKLDATRPPDSVWIQTNVNTRLDLNPSAEGSTQIATVSDWIYREGDWYCSILRDRLSNRILFTPEEIKQRNFNGIRLKGKTINIVLVWNKDSGHFVANSCSLAYE